MESKRRGRPFADPATKMSRMLRVMLTPRQDKLLQKLKLEQGMSESEHVRRAIDEYLRKLIKNGELQEE